MILLTERVEQQLKDCLQKEIRVSVKERHLYTGKLLLYRIDGFYIVLVFRPEGNNSHNPTSTIGSVEVEIPYPFNTITESKKIVFDYRLDSLAEKDYNLLFVLQSISKKRESKYYNSTLEIQQL